MSFETDEFRNVMGLFATGCTIMTLPGDPQHGMTANAFSSVSIEPPLCLICVDHGTRTHDLLVAEGIDTFGVNILSKAQRDLAEHFAGMRELDEDPFADRDIREGQTGSVIFENSLAYLECTVHDLVESGDHTIAIGYIEDLGESNPDSEPLIFFRGKWSSIR